MRTQCATLTAGLWAALLAPACETAVQSQVAGPRFDVVSVKLSAPSGGLPRSTRIVARPDGGFVATNVPVTLLLSRAYPGTIPGEMESLPDWARTERYDVSATSSMSEPSAEDRQAMLRAMLEDRFRLVVRLESRQRPAFDLVIARDDRRLGPKLAPIDVDCEAVQAAAAAQPPPPTTPNLNAPPPPCVIRIVENRVEGEGTMANIATWLRTATGRVVVDKTGLQGSFRLATEYDVVAARRPDLPRPPDAPPSIFTAVSDDLGLRLVSSTADRETLIVERLEKPTEN